LRDRDQREIEQRRADLGLGKVMNLLSRSPVPEMKKPASQPEDETDTVTSIRIEGEVGEEGVT